MLVPLHIGASGPDPILIDIDPALVETDMAKDIFIEEQLPEFMTIGGSIDHRTFVDFVKAYYRWMGTTGQAAYESFDLLNKRDVDGNVDKFIDNITDEYMSEFPRQLAEGVSKDNIVKNIKSFYNIKGTEDSYKVLFRVLFNEDVSFYYPKEDILRLSDGRWNEPSMLKTTRLSSVENIFKTVGRKLEQKNVQTGKVEAYADIQAVSLYERGGYTVSEFELSDVFGTFVPERHVTCTLADSTEIEEYVYPTIKSISVVDGGTGYTDTDKITISGGNGSSAKARISTIGDSGAVKKVEVVDGGINYRSGDTITATVSSNNGSGCTLGVSGGGAVEPRDGFYSTNDGLLDSNKKMQDNFYYQDFSYVLKTGKNFLDYKNQVKSIIHPAGTALFGNILLKSLNTIATTEESSETKREIPILGHYTPYTFNTYKNLRSNGTGGSGGTDLYPSGYGFSAGEGNTYAIDTSTSAHNPFAQGGVSGPLGGVTHGAETNTLNSPVGEQFLVEDGSITGAGLTNYWTIYPNPNSRGITEMPYFGIGTIQDIELDVVESSNPPYSHVVYTGDTWFNGELVRQEIPLSQDAVGVILKQWNVGDKLSLRVNVLSGTFLSKSTEVIGGTLGFLSGASGGATAYINNATDYSTDGDSAQQTDFKRIQIQDFLFGIER